MAELTALQKFMLSDAKLSYAQVSCAVLSSQACCQTTAYTVPHGDLQLRHSYTGANYSCCQDFPQAQFVFILFNSYIMFEPPPKCICLQKEPRGEVQPTNKNIIITQFSSAWASPGYSLVLCNPIVSPSRPYLIG